MKSMSKILMIAFALVILIGIQSVYAIPTLQLKSGAITKTIADGGILDANPDAGVVTYIGAIGVFNINVSTGVTKPAIGSASLPDIDLNSVNINARGAGTLNIRFSEVNFGPYTGGFTTIVGGTTHNNSVSFQTYVDSGNVLFGTGTMISNLGPFSGITSFNATDSGGNGTYFDPFSMTIDATVTTNAGSNVSFDAEVVTPEPSTLMLLGSGLMGAAFYARRRKIK